MAIGHGGVWRNNCLWKMNSVVIANAVSSFTRGILWCELF